MDDVDKRSHRHQTSVVRRSRAAALAGGVTLLALVPRLLTAGRFTMADEPTWLERSGHFSDALLSGELTEASAPAGVNNNGDATMPGVTTMWIGSFARGIWAVGRSWGLWAGDQMRFTDSAGLAVAQVTMVVVGSLLVGLVTFLVVRWAGWVAAAVAGVLLATEPYFVAYGTVLHTDELLTLLGLAALVATALALGLPRPTAWSGRWWAGALAGALWGGAFLTKLSALPILISMFGLGAWAVVHAWRDQHTHTAEPDREDRPTTQTAQAEDTQAAHAEESWPTSEVKGPSIGALLRVGVCGAVVAAVVILIAYPALWVQPLQEYQHMRRSARLAGRGHRQFFLGERTHTPGPLYYLVVLPLRSTPWFLVAGVVAALGLWWRRATRGFGVALLIMAVPTMIVLSLASKQFNRYGLPVLAVGAIAVGVMASGAGETLAVSLRRPPRPLLAGLLIAGLVTLHSVWIAPWSNAYFNPLLGGASTAETAFAIGGGEGLERAGALIQEREGHRCNDVLIWTYPIENAYPCGSVASSRQRRDLPPTAYDYVVVYVNERQRRDPEYLAPLVEGRELVDVVMIRGITYAEIFGPATPDS